MTAVAFAPKDENIYRESAGGGIGNDDPRHITVSCPHCGQLGSFGGIPNLKDATYNKNGALSKDGKVVQPAIDIKYRAGLRICPNIHCKGIVAVISNDVTALPVAVSPPQLITFRTDNIPAKLVLSMKEAIASHGVQAFRAAALMVRRTLELLCEEKGATGKDLKERLSKLSQHAILPPKLLEAAGHLRLLGNDAAHVEAKTYDDVDEPHAALAIEVAREILKAVYQHDDLVSRLTQLRKV